MRKQIVALAAVFCTKFSDQALRHVGGGDSKEIQGRLPMEAGGGNGRSVATWQKDLAAGASPAWAAA